MGGSEEGGAICQWYSEGLVYKRGAQVEVWGYSDSGHAGEKETSRGRAGYIFMSAGAAISWRSSMLKEVTHNSCESEYIGLSNAGNEAIYLQQLQEEMKIGKKGVLLYGDNESSLKLAVTSTRTQSFISVESTS